MGPTLFITGTDTGVGKTVLTCLLADFLRRRDYRVAAFKPLCSGGRADARALHTALGGALTLDAINPWHFRAPVSPALAACREKKPVTLGRVLAHIRAVEKPFTVTLVEGAGGLLSPLGVGFDSRDLLLALRATPVIVAANRLGVINHVRLSCEALPPKLRLQCRIILMTPPNPDAATSTNAGLLKSWVPRNSVFQLPWFGTRFDLANAADLPSVVRTLRALTATLAGSMQTKLSR
jgi:dethiobiotin synthetase